MFNDLLVLVIMEGISFENKRILIQKKMNTAWHLYLFLCYLKVSKLLNSFLDKTTGFWNKGILFQIAEKLLVSKKWIIARQLLQSY